MTQLRVATYNTWNCQGDFDRRLALMSAGLKALNADVILLQEVFTQVPSGQDVARTFGDDLDMSVAHVPARKKLRGLNGVPVLSCSGLAVLSRGPIGVHQSVRLPEDARDGERLGQVVSTRIDTHEVLLANVHLSHLAGEDGLRQRQLDALMNHVASIPDHDVTVLGGDMNLVAGHSILSALQKDRDVQGVSYAAPPTTTLNPVDPMPPSMGVIDHVFVKATGKCFAHANIALNTPDEASGVFPSDHMAVVVDIAFN